jgi:chromosome segregation ATPase
LEQSSSVFRKYEDTIDKLSKTAQSLQETNGDLKKQNEEAYAQLANLTSELEAVKRNEQKAKEKCECLEKLCRSLSAERSALQKRIDEICTGWSVVENQISGLKTQVGSMLCLLRAYGYAPCR